MPFNKVLRELPLCQGIYLNAFHFELHEIRAMTGAFCALKDRQGYQALRFSDFMGEHAVTNGCKLFKFLGMRQKHASALSNKLFGQGVTGAGAPNRLINHPRLRKLLAGKHITAGTYNRTQQEECVQQSAIYPELLTLHEILRTGEGCPYFLYTTKDRPLHLTP